MSALLTSSPVVLKDSRIPQVDYCEQIRKRGVLIYAYANNHFGGHAPATIEQFRNLWRSKGLPEIDKPQRQELSLFPE